MVTSPDNTGVERRTIRSTATEERCPNQPYNPTWQISLSSTDLWCSFSGVHQGSGVIPRPPEDRELP